MLQLAVLSENLVFAPQISPENVAEIAKLGFKQIVCNRPDGEESIQPSIDTIRAEGQKHGVDVVYAPVARTDVTAFTADVVRATMDALANDKKTLMYCRTGTRSSLMWSISQIKAGVSPDAIFEQLRPIGYDVCSMQDTITKVAENT